MLSQRLLIGQRMAKCDEVFVKTSLKSLCLRRGVFLILGDPLSARVLAVLSGASWEAFFFRFVSLSL